MLATRRHDIPGLGIGVTGISSHRRRQGRGNGFVSIGESDGRGKVDEGRDG